jgi:hypothetical protein
VTILLSESALMMALLVLRRNQQLGPVGHVGSHVRSACDFEVAVEALLTLIFSGHPVGKLLGQMF